MLNKPFITLTSSRTLKILVLSVGTVSTTWAQDHIVPPMVNIPAGHFMMGAEGGDPATMPIHRVSVDDFQLGKYTVTVAEFRKFADDTGFTRESTCNDFIDKEGLRGPKHIGSGRWDKHRHSYSDYQPVTCISWQDANAYAGWLTSKTGTKYRLPTEQEWEYSAKANTTSRYFWGDDPDTTKACLYGNYADQTGEHINNNKYGMSNVGWIEHVNCDDGEAYNAMVGLYRPNPFGLFDIDGNVGQYLNSCYFEDGYKSRSKEELDVNKCEFIVHRGGNWHYPAQPHATRNRFKREGWNVGTGMGFRLAVDGHSSKLAESAETTAKFEKSLKQAQTEHLATRSKIPTAPKNTQLVKVPSDSKGNTYQLSWQPSTDKGVTGYEIYQSKSRYAHLYGGFYQKHYQKLQTVNATENSMDVTLPNTGGSFRVIAVTDKDTSLPSKIVTVFVEPEAVNLPGKINMQDTIALENIPLYHREARTDKSELYYLFKTNKGSDQSTVTASFKINVKKSAWYTLNYRGGSFHTGEFFKLWQNNTLVGKIDYDPEIDDKTSNRHKVFLGKGKQTLQVSVLREGFDRWSMVWLEFTELTD